jgi:4-alpha-glucanotransferase
MGELGPCTIRWLDFLAECGQGIWQILPIHPPGPGRSPYQAHSAMAGDPLLIGLEGLLSDGLLERSECAPFPESPAGCIAHGTVLPARERLLCLAAKRFLDSGPDQNFLKFCRTEADWLDDYALFDLLQSLFPGLPWTAWPAPIRNRDHASLATLRDQFLEKIALRQALQYLFHRQWLEMRARAAANGIKIFGDLPLFVAQHSADVWSRRELFDLLPDGTPRVVAGVPPDYFSETGQRWGNPLYRWDRHEETGHGWWLQRLERATALHDALRLDHFRGFVSFWEIPADEPTAVGGRWVQGPGEDFFRKIFAKLGPLPLIAEDLGILGKDVIALRNRLELPGLRILLFALDDFHPTSPYLPENFSENCVAYTGTHDNDTLHGALFENGTASASRRSLLHSILPTAYRGHAQEDGVLAWLADSPARWVLFPLQDVLHLGSSARINRPGTANGNWSWRVSDDQLGSLDRKFLRRLGSG